MTTVNENSLIRVAAKRIPGLSDLTLRDGLVTSYSGMLFDIWNEIAKSNNFSYDVLLGDGEIMGSPINGSSVWSGMIGMVRSNRADIIVGPVSVTAQRAAAVEFTIPIYEDATCVLTTATSNKGANRFLKLFQPFEYRVWLCIIASLVIYSTILYLIHHLFAKKTSKLVNSKEYLENHEVHHTSFGMYLFFMFGRVLMQDLEMQHLIFLKSERILMFFWWVFAIIMNNLYTSVLVSLLIITKYEPIINSVEDLGRLKSYSLCLQAGGYQIEYFNKAKNPIYQDIYKYIQTHPSDMQYLSIASSIFEESLQGRCFGFVDQMVGRVIVSLSKAQNITCVDYWAPANIAFAYRKNWVHSKAITETLTKLHENGVISLITRNYLNPKSAKKTQVNDKTVITLENLFSILVLYAGAVAFSILIQAIEFVIRKKLIAKVLNYLRNFRNTDNKNN